MTYTHYGWQVSPYSAKTRSYFQFKKIPFTDVVPSAIRFYFIQKAVGRIIMPTVLQPDGTWLQDSSEIIQTLEARYPDRSIIPPGPKQKLTSLLLEMHADEWLPLISLNTRWNIPENHNFAIQEFARDGFPFLPSFIGKKMSAPMARKMQSYLPVLGITEKTIPGIQSFRAELIAELNTHLEQYPFLLGSRPCLGDFSLYGPLWAHCYRDPGSRHLFDDAPALVRWFERLASPDGSVGEFLKDDEVPSTLDPILKTLFSEQWSYLLTLVEKIDAWCEKNPDAHRVPRALGNCVFKVGGHTDQRRLLTFMQWKAQRALEAYAAFSTEEQESVDLWLDSIGFKDALKLKIANPLERKNFKMLLKNRPS